MRSELCLLLLTLFSSYLVKKCKQLALARACYCLLTWNSLNNPRIKILIVHLLMICWIIKWNCESVRSWAPVPDILNGLNTLCFRNMLLYFPNLHYKLRMISGQGRVFAYVLYRHHYQHLWRLWKVNKALGTPYSFGEKSNAHVEAQDSRLLENAPHMLELSRG